MFVIVIFHMYMLLQFAILVLLAHIACVLGVETKINFHRFFVVNVTLLAILAPEAVFFC